MSVFAVPAANKFARVTAGIAAPSDIANLAHQYRADTGITIVTGVSAWNDMVGTAHLLQGTGSLQPTFTASAQNGQPGVTGDGVDDILAATVARSEPRTVILVAKWTSSTGGLWDGTTVNTNRLYRSAAGTLSGIGDGATFSVAGLNLTSYHCHCFVANGTSSSYSQEVPGSFTQASDGAPGAAGGITMFNLGGGAGAGGGTVLEALDYSRALTLDELKRIQAYMKTRYAL